VSEPGAILCEWTDNGVMRPISSLWSRRADAQWVVGARYMMHAEEERSDNSHRHFFASVNEAWMNLPDDLAARFPSADHLRYWALIKAGFYNERTLPCPTPEMAQQVAAFVRPSESYAIITVDEDCIVRVFTPRSQSYRSMDRATFQDSKTKVLAVISDLLGVTPAQLSGNEAA